jgi:hypothetical protein
LISGPFPLLTQLKEKMLTATIILRRAGLPKCLILDIFIKMHPDRSLVHFARVGYMPGIFTIVNRYGFRETDRFVRAAIRGGSEKVLIYALEKRLIDSSYVLYAALNLHIKSALILTQFLDHTGKSYIYYKFIRNTVEKEQKPFPRPLMCKFYRGESDFLALLARQMFLRKKIKELDYLLDFAIKKNLDQTPIRVYAILFKNFKVADELYFIDINKSAAEYILMHGTPKPIKYLIKIYGLEETRKLATNYGWGKFLTK